MKICPECHAEFEDTVKECPRHNTAPKTNDQNPLIGVYLANRYQIISVIGSGGTGVVYKARHEQMDRFVAVKMMHSHMVARPEALKNFYTEAKTVAQLKHHNIITLFDFGIGPGNQPFIAMDYIDGSSLKGLLEKDGHISLEQMRTLLPQIVDGLAYAHSEGIIHQDLKPENIMLTRSNNGPQKVTLVDFGMSVLHNQEKDLNVSGNKKKKFAGSPFYMSPEQCLLNSTVDNRSDIYSLAFVLYEALSGKLPFEIKSGMAMMDSHVRETPKPFNLSNPEIVGSQVCTEITRVFNQAMSKQPEDRYQTIEEFGAELADALARDTVKWKAVMHRGVAAEQVLVHARQTMQHMEALDTGKYKALAESTALQSQLQSGKQFLSRQAEIEATYLTAEALNTDEPIIGEPKSSLVTKLLKRMTSICRAPAEEIFKIAGTRELTECPFCQAKVTQGVPFCLTCQRKLVVPSAPTKLSDTRNGNSFTYHRLNKVNTQATNLESRSTIHHLRQQGGMPNLSGVQRLLNCALIIGIVISGIMFIQNYFSLDKSWKTLSELVHLPNNPPSLYMKTGRQH